MKKVLNPTEITEASCTGHCQSSCPAGGNEVIEKKQKRSYRTKKAAGDVAEIPPYVLAITNKQYLNAITFNRNAAAYLRPITNAGNLSYKNGRIYDGDSELSLECLAQRMTSDGIEKYDLLLLRIFFTVILNKMEKDGLPKSQGKEHKVRIYFPDLVKQMGKSRKIAEKNYSTYLNQIKSFQNVMGVIGNAVVLPVITLCEHNVQKNTITIQSPYFESIISKIYEASRRTDKHGNAILNGNGKPRMLPAYSYMIMPSIANEKCKAAVEIVFIVVAMIERCGKHENHIAANTIIGRNPLLSRSLGKCKTQGNINNVLKRVFSKAWELLTKKTTLKEHYKDIQLPDMKAEDFRERWIPTSSTLDKVFSFPHQGKTRS